MINFPYIITPSSSVLKIVPWSTGTDEEIAAMITAADQGKINLTKCWSVGDERVVHLSAMSANSNGVFTSPQAEQDVVWRLANEGYSGVDNESINFVWVQKDCLSLKAGINPTNTIAGSWGGCALRTDLNNLYYNAIPQTLRNSLKTFKTYYADDSNNTLVAVSDKIAIFAEKEIFGSMSWGSNAEESLERITDFKYTDALEKHDAEGNLISWWTRTWYGYAGTDYIEVLTNKNSAPGNASTKLGIAPFGCI